MRIILVFSATSPWALNMVEAFAHAGFQVSGLALCPRRSSNYQAFDSEAGQKMRRGIRELCEHYREVEVESMGLAAIFELQRQIRSMFNIVKPDFVMSLYGGMLGLAVATSGVPRFGVFAVGSDVLRVSGMQRFLSRWTLNRASLVAANSDFLAAEVKKLAPKAWILPVVLGVNYDRFSLGSPPDSPIRIVCTRGFSPVYGQASILEALSLWNPPREDWEFVFTAGGPQLQEAKDWVKENLSEAARERVSFLGGVPQEQLAQILQQSHIYVSMSLSDSSSNSLMEAMACGLRCLVSNIPANQVWQIPGSEGVQMIPVQDGNALARALESALIAPQMFLQNRERVMEAANSKRALESLKAQIQSLAKPSA